MARKRSDEFVKAPRASDWQMSDGMSLDTLIDALKKCNQSAPVVFRNGTFPGTVDSWRGVYEFPALGFDYGDSEKKVSGLLRDLEISVTRKGFFPHVFRSYKGGEYTYEGFETVYVDNYGEYTGPGYYISGVTEVGGVVYLETKAREVKDD